MGIVAEKLACGEFDRETLDCSYNWLNDAEVRALTDAPPVERQAQLEWYNTLPARQNFLIWSIRYDNKPIGVLGLKHVTGVDAEYWGYLGEKQFWGQRIGPWMMETAHAFAKERGLQRVYLRVLKDNERAIRLYSKSGYTVDQAASDDRMLVMTKTL